MSHARVDPGSLFVSTGSNRSTRPSDYGPFSAIRIAACYIGGQVLMEGTVEAEQVASGFGPILRRFSSPDKKSAGSRAFHASDGARAGMLSAL